jgi:hypothetical protein
MKSWFITLMVLVVQCSFGQVASDAPVDWTHAGYRGKTADIPRYFDRIVHVKTEFNVKGDSVTDDAPEIQRAINAYSDFAVYYFPAGTYCLGSTITLRSNCLILGAGSSKTIFKNTHENSVFLIVGSAEAAVPAPYAVELAKDIQTMTLPFSVSAGDFIEISAHDSSVVVPGDEAAWNYCIGQVVRVKQVNGSSVTLDDKLRMNYNTLAPKAAKMHSVSNVGFENFKVSNESPTRSSNFSTNFNFSYATDCWIMGVESRGSGLAHVQMGSSSNIEIQGCYFHEAQDYGEGGHGYGVCIGNHSSSCLIENNIFRTLRHAMILAGGANGNVFGFNFSTDVYSSWEPDICIHGHYPFANLFEGNYADFAQADLVWGVNGPYNAFFRNTLTRMPTSMCWGVETKEGGIRIDHQNGFRQHFYVLGNAVRDVECVFGGLKMAWYFDWGDLDLEDGNTGLDHGTHGSFIIRERTSYYKDSRPMFISTDYTWPPLGCNYSGSIPSRTIPAKDRWYAGGVVTVSSPPITNPLSVQSISGTITYANTAAHAVGNVNVILTPGTGNALSATSTANGTYTIPNVAAGTYTLTAHKTGTWGGVNASDALCIVRHALNITRLNGLSAIAGDADNNGEVNMDDALLIVQRAAGLSASFTAGDWIFTNQQVTVGSANVIANITAIAVGDVNASYLSGSGTTFPKKSLVDLKSGTKRFSISASSSAALGSVSMKINIGSGRIAGISSKLPGFVSRIEDSCVWFVWFAQDGKTLIHFDANEVIATVTLAEKIIENSNGTIEFECTDIHGADRKIGFVITGQDIIPDLFEIKQNYPNPFNPSTQIEYSVPRSGVVILTVHNLLGQEVAVLVNEQKHGGSYSVRWTPKNMASGIYLCRIHLQTEMGSITSVKRLSYLK